MPYGAGEHHGSKICIAVVGCGRIATNGHFPAFRALSDMVRVKYACDRSVKAALKQKEYPELVENVITDYKIALADPEVEAVYVLTPNYAHYVVTMDALRAGKHVFCEKPITVNYKLSEEMAAEAKKQGKILNIGVCNRYNKSVEMLEEMNRKENSATSIMCIALSAVTAVSRGWAARLRPKRKRAAACSLTGACIFSTSFCTYWAARN
ncbi:MAG: Gfo/Idh/MocA family protein [Candidatus Borkfalkia sp.]